MTTTTAAALVLLLGAIAGSPLRAQPVSPDQAAAIRQGVQATLDAYRERSAAGQWEALLRLYADEPQFRWVSNGALVARSFDDIRKHFLAQPAGSRAEQTYQDVEITPLAPDAAEVLTRFETKLIDPAGAGFSFGGLMTLVMVRRGESWLILSGHSSTPQRR
jgi:hypothetical protein